MTPEEFNQQETAQAYLRLVAIEHEIEDLRRHFGITDLTTSERIENHRWIEIIQHLLKNPKTEEIVEAYNLESLLERLQKKLTVLSESLTRLASEGETFEKRHPKEALLVGLVLITLNRLKQIIGLMDDIEQDSSSLLIESL